MVVLTPGSNASAPDKHIGRIDVPIIWDTDAALYSTQIPTAFASLSYAKKRELNDFFIGLKTAGLKAKITHLFLPCLGRAEGGVNLMDPSYNTNFPTSNATYDSKGIYFNLGWQVPFAKNLKENHAGTYNSTIPAVDTAGRHSIAQTATNHILGRYVINPNAAGFRLNASTVNGVTIGGLGMTIGPLIGSVSESLGKLHCQVNTSPATKDITYVAGSASAQLLLGGNAVSGTAGLALCSHSLFTFGGYLTQAEIAAYATLQTALMTALLV